MSASKDAKPNEWNRGECWVSTYEAGRFLGVSQRQVCRLINKGVLPAKARGRVYHVRVQDLKAHMENLPDAKQEAE